jgi:hypothetical protein
MALQTPITHWLSIPWLETCDWAQTVNDIPPRGAGD